ncbi:glycosyltransferase [Rhizobium sp. BK377]|uniref:glycosyltransferase n=1 Tax=Rhizobium sp. BK377 TaxID=2587058 RepID=UPI0017EE2E92|nr:glycosyltransferase [Rhizobium sp. BK377]MBB3462642.1 glycosyltransferase involved in cell wall biosynthesis [Rhizobium sp. BK377]
MDNKEPTVKVKQIQQFQAGGDYSADCMPPATKRILHVLFASELAGSERYCIDLANGQAALGHEVHLVVPRGLPVAELVNRQVILHRFTTPFLRRMRLRRLIAMAGIDIAHGHLSSGCKALATVPDTVTRVATLHVGFKAKQHARLDGVICVNRAQLPRLGAYTGHAGLVWNWLPEVKHGKVLNLRSELNIPPGTRLVGAVGRLHPSKGNDVLISAFVRAAPADAALVIAGEGPQRPALEKLAKGDSRVHLLGHCDNVPGFLRNLDLFVSPSREESAGLAILEAMHEGLPIIASATEGPSEYLREHPVRFVEPGSVENLSEALADALGSDADSRLARMDYDMEPFSRAAGVAKVLQFYIEVAASRRVTHRRDAEQSHHIA